MPDRTPAPKPERDLPEPKNLTPRTGICPRCRSQTLEIDPASGRMHCSKCGLEINRPMMEQ